MKIIAIACGGVLGALLRYAVSGFTYRFTSAHSAFPWGTLAVNLAGCFAAGLLWGVSERAVLSPHFKPFVFVGVLGAFTTFSTFGLESFHLLRDGEYAVALFNIAANNLAGLLLLYLGYVASQYLLRSA